MRGAARGLGYSRLEATPAASRGGTGLAGERRGPRTAPRGVHRLHRILRIIRLLQGGRPLSNPQLSAEYQVSSRTIFRDLDVIERAGFIIWYDRKEATYRLHPKQFMPPLGLKASEAAELMIGVSVLGGDHGIPLLDHAHEAVTKLEACLSLDARAGALAGRRTTEVRLGPLSRHNHARDAFDMVHASIRHQKRLRCRYASLEDRARIEFGLNPYWLLFYGRAWYAIGHATHLNKVATFKLSRFKDLEPAGQTFHRPPGYTLDDYLGNAWGVTPGERYEVELEFSPQISPYVAEVQWHRTQRTRWDGQGALRFFAVVDGLDEIAWWVHGFGAHVQVLAPEALRTRVAELSLPVPGGPHLKILDI